MKINNIAIPTIINKIFLFLEIDYMTLLVLSWYYVCYSVPSFIGSNVGYSSGTGK